MIITLCSKAKFFDRLYKVKAGIESKGHEVLLPSMVDYHNLEEAAFLKIHHDLIRDHLRKIDGSHAIYVANYYSRGIEGYIDGSSLLGMGKAFDKGIPIFLLNEVSNMINYKKEILAMQPIVVGTDWDKLDKFLREYYKK